MSIDYSVSEIGLDQAYDLIKQLQNKTTYDSSGAQVISGDHPTRGFLFFIIPPLSNPLLIPIAIRKTDV